MKHIITSAALTAVIAGTSAAQAADKFCPMGNEGYAVDARGHVVIDSSGHCVRTSQWTEALRIPGCDGEAVTAEAPAPEPAPAPAPAPVTKAVEKTVSLTAGALFDNNSDAIKPAGQAELDALAAHLKQMKEIQSVGITGHTDSAGSEAYNQQLSMRRAIAVKNYLMDQGISPEVMTTMGKGESAPVASNATKEGRAQNRRVEISIQGSTVVVQ